MYPNRESIREKITIRRLDSSDSIHELTELLHRAYKEYVEMGLNCLAATQDDEVTRQRIKDSECWVAVLDDQIVGTVTFTDSKQTGGRWWYRRPDVAKWSLLSVEPDFQGLGIGSMLLGTVERRALETGALELAGSMAIQKRDLIAMYKRKGYRLIQYVSWSDANYVCAIHSKSLRGNDGKTKLWGCVLQKVVLYGSFVKCKLLRRNDGKKRLWVRVLRKVRFWRGEQRCA